VVPKSRRERLSLVRENPLFTIFGVVVPVIIAIAWGFYDIQGRLGRLEGRVDVLSELVERKVVTETVVVTSTTTQTSVPFPPIPGFPLESIIAGLLLGTILVLALRRLRTS
jgi:hypothetical protein